jgi:hypothetical protein
MVNKNAQQIFLSYSRPDQDQVEQIARRLDKEGYKVWYDNASLVPGGVLVRCHLPRVAQQFPLSGVCRI